jgi:hypothetical protein
MRLRHGSFTRQLLCVFALSACYQNKPVTQPLEVKGPIRVGFDVPTRLLALADGDSVMLVDVTLLVGRVQRFENDTLLIVVSEVVGRAEYPIGAPRVSSLAGTTAIVPGSAQPRMYVRESEMRNKYIPFAAVVGVLALAVGIVALLLTGHGT